MVNDKVLYLRCVELEDMKLLYEWRNDKIVRMNSLNSDIISYDTHCKWFKEKIKSKDSQIYICMKDNQPIGQIRIECDEEEAEISYLIAAEYRGKGYGREIIKLLEQEVIRDIKIKKLVATVKGSNIASQKCFEYLNYDKLEEGKVVYYSKRL